MALPLLYASCAGLDVHKATLVACVLQTAPSGKVTEALRTFATTTTSLQDLADWLATQAVTHVAMESTGIYSHELRNEIVEELIPI
jgi:transposase